MNNVKLSNGITMPGVSLGTSKVKSVDNAISLLSDAYDAGYRHFDTAQGYLNEDIIGTALSRLSVPRSELFITGKLDDCNHTYKKTIDSFFDSLTKLGIDYFDMFLVHSPNSKSVKELAKTKSIDSETKYWCELNRETWYALEELYNKGKIKAIGVSNFNKNHLEELSKTATIKPMVNQIKLCVGCYPIQSQLIDYCNSNNIHVQAYSALGKGQVSYLEHVSRMSKKYKVIPSQIALMFLSQLGFSFVCRSNDKIHLSENIRFNRNLKLDDDDMNTLKNILTNEKWGKVYNPDLLER